MDSVTLTKQNRLFWLGRYAERVCTMIPYLVNLFDGIIDGKTVEYYDICQKLGVYCDFTDAEDFCRRYTFDENLACSVRSSAEFMLGNGMMLREIISSDTLAYLQLSRDSIVSAAISEVPTVGLQNAVDYIMAFRGSFDDYVVSPDVRNIIKTGRSIERLSLMLRLDYQSEFLERELNKLAYRAERAGFIPAPESAKIIEAARKNLDNADKAALLCAVEGMFTV